MSTWYYYIAVAVFIALLFGFDVKGWKGHVVAIVFSLIWPLAVAFLVTSASIAVLNREDESREGRINK